ncbi:hypothetical protein RJ640_015725 [Escallonia rubra]|uniref:Retrotransposon gag domain-containing protein n=1 Tax=Escallonia rubra TaxID=112253 RepID=A0AA88RZR0_9ASTE|nr:hypothetical protein RJ640_015725 [Escallonia rubra]
MEHCFEALNMEDKDDKAKIVALYLKKTITLWWRCQCSDKEKGTCKIDTWEEFKKALTKQFYPENVEFEMYHKMRRLRHTGSLFEYAKEYSTTILELPNMADRKALYGGREDSRVQEGRIVQESKARPKKSPKNDHCNARETTKAVRMDQIGKQGQ